MIYNEKVMFAKQRLQNGASIEKVRSDLEASGMSASDTELVMQHAVSTLSPGSVTHSTGSNVFLKMFWIIILLLIIGLSVFYVYGLYSEKVSVEPVTNAVYKGVHFVSEFVRNIVQ